MHNTGMKSSEIRVLKNVDLLVFSNDMALPYNLHFLDIDGELVCLISTEPKNDLLDFTVTLQTYLACYC